MGELPAQNLGGNEDEKIRQSLERAPKILVQVQERVRLSMEKKQADDLSGALNELILCYHMMNESGFRASRDSFIVGFIADIVRIFPEGKGIVSQNGIELNRV